MAEITPVQLRLLYARLAVMGDDKALGREIFHQLVDSGMAPHEVDAWRPAEAPVRPVRPVEASEPVETADAAPAPEHAVKRGPGRPRKVG